MGSCKKKMYPASRRKGLQHDFILNVCLLGVRRELKIISIHKAAFVKKDVLRRLPTHNVAKYRHVCCFVEMRSFGSTLRATVSLQTCTSPHLLNSRGIEADFINTPKYTLSQFP